MKRSLLGRAGVVAAVAAAAVFAVAGPASAHVTVNPNSATQGAYTKVSFRVPTESDTASTTKLEVNIPTDAPIASVSLKPVPGWTAATVTTKLATPVKTDDGEISEAVSKITWTAAKGSEIKPGQFQEFDVSLGPLPKTNQIVFKALQTYSDGTIIRWIDEPTTDGSEPEKPAPVLKLTAAGADTAAGSGSAPTVTTVAATKDSDDGNGGMAWGIAGLAAGVIALVLGLLAYRRSGQKSA
ncbi:YcnI family protein [Actinoplanes sp. TBRC 11911]|uniref:YcnI family protein n=1 Tax=Actinoplanes sp. TBRC 11911 TaxID=2729386 RepID=UPI00145E3F38|nr:YcnI family protein [Actinoplanes sp. TBRC 11911]NMO51469.1 YcnI family protein [Actinoplanes sp. TBRC 11911]